MISLMGGHKTESNEQATKTNEQKLIGTNNSTGVPRGNGVVE